MEESLMENYKAVVIGCSRMGGFIDNEIVGRSESPPPFSHAAVYSTCGRTELVGCSDLRADVMEEFGRLYDVPKERQYLDYRQLIEQEKPDIVSVATQPEQRAEIVVYAAEHGAKAIYAEKAMAASMDEADQMVEAVERNGVVFNLGTNRRWDTGFDAMKHIIDSGELGDLGSVLIYNTGELFNGGSHAFDLILRLNDDQPVSWVQAHLPRGYRGEHTDGNDFIGFDGDAMVSDPAGHGILQFENDVTAYALLSDQGGQYEAVCEKGTVTCLGNGREWRIVRQRDGVGPGEAAFDYPPYPEFERVSPTLRLVEDLVHALDTGAPTRGGVTLARRNQELIFAFIESHRRGGERVRLPLRNCTLKLQRGVPPKQPKFRPNAS
jgi:predicted dehydrogenase